MDRYVYKFVCPKCGKIVLSQQVVQIRPSDVCQSCYWTHQQQMHTNVLTCVRVVGTPSKILLSD